MDNITAKSDTYAQDCAGFAPVDPRTVHSVCILGSGVTGDGVAGYFRSLPQAVKIDFYNDDAMVSRVYDLAVVSPGIPPHSQMVVSAKAHSRELISEPELAFRVSPEKWVVITGTNGKTTTTALTAHILNGANILARVAGNIGTTCIEAVQTRAKDEYIVAELSSYQLAYSKTIVADAAVLLNITPDHLNWHGSFDAYKQAKLSLLERMHDNQPVIVDATMNETANVVANRLAAGLRTIPIGSQAGLTGDMTLGGSGGTGTMAQESAYVDAATSVLGCNIGGNRISLINCAQLQIKGDHNQENALAASTVALTLGADAELVVQALCSFKALEHRIEFVAEFNGVSYFNDSKATNPEATCKALNSFAGSGLIVMLGGLDKGTALDEMVSLASAACKAVVCYGQAGSHLIESFSSADKKTLSLHQSSNFNSAFDLAHSLAASGDVVLLSPACASFDEFKSYEARGNHFKQLVMQLQEQKAISGETKEGSA
jgi:UDP-N-acetylmuramoylalanine--D-glutamate ligase